MLGAAAFTGQLLPGGLKGGMSLVDPLCFKYKRRQSGMSTEAEKAEGKYFSSCNGLLPFSYL